MNYNTQKFESINNKLFNFFKFKIDNYVPHEITRQLNSENYKEAVSFLDEDLKYVLVGAGSGSWDGVSYVWKHYLFRYNDGIHNIYFNSNEYDLFVDVKN